MEPVKPCFRGRLARLGRLVPAPILALGVLMSADPQAVAAGATKDGGRPASYASLQALPDWSGTWVMPDQARGEFLKSESAQGPFREGYAEQWKGKKSNAASCVTTGMPGVMAVPLGFEFLFTPGRVTILSEEGPTIRRVYTDGRPHSTDTDPTYAGESIGHWEGNALVIDTVSITPKSEFFRGVKTSGEAHVTERISRIDSEHMLVETSIEDPKALRSTWRYRFTYVRSRTPFIESYYCDDNRDANGEPDLQPPQ